MKKTETPTIISVKTVPINLYMPDNACGGGSNACGG